VAIPDADTTMVGLDAPLVDSSPGERAARCRLWPLDAPFSRLVAAPSGSLVINTTVEPPTRYFGLTVREHAELVCRLPTGAYGLGQACLAA
jgi:hypothetical protein